MNFPWCVDSLWRRDEESKKGHKHNTTQNTHTSLCQELAQVPLMTKFSNLLEARCLIDSIQWASSSPRPAKAGRQAGRQAACASSKIQYPRFLSGAMYDLFFFLVGFIYLQGSDFYYQTFFFFFSTKIWNFLGRNCFFCSLNLT
jgi:hypothetical protein